MTDQNMRLILAGDPVEAIEAAKRLIADDIVDGAPLAKVATNKKNRPWARIAVIYALGFADDESTAGLVLTDIVGDRDDIEECRARAAEALGHLRLCLIGNRLRQGSGRPQNVRSDKADRRSRRGIASRTIPALTFCRR